MSVSAPVTAKTRGSLHDGEGVRTVVYLKGCTLRCQWCHNPETFSSCRQLMFSPIKCIGCGRCVQICPENHILHKGKASLISYNCAACGNCAEACPTGALSICGEMQTPQEVFEQILQDQHYFAASGGGITVSGGECLLYPAFTARLLQLCQEAGIGTAIETALHVPWESVEQVVPWVDTVYADCKHPDARAHQHYTGSDNLRIRANLQRLTCVHDKVEVHIPVIPGVNDTEEIMEGFARVLSDMGPGLKGIQLLRYNYLGKAKYTLLGKEYVSFGNEAQSDETMRTLCGALASHLHKEIPVFFRD